ncbi:MAG: hypothetical protein QXT73_06745 [Candidatus Methanomethylicaceae archaeon]
MKKDLEKRIYAAGMLSAGAWAELFRSTDSTTMCYPFDCRAAMKAALRSGLSPEEAREIVKKFENEITISLAFSREMLEE